MLRIPQQIYKKFFFIEHELVAADSKIFSSVKKDYCALALSGRRKRVKNFFHNINNSEFLHLVFTLLIFKFKDWSRGLISCWQNQNKYSSSDTLWNTKDMRKIVYTCKCFTIFVPENRNNGEVLKGFWIYLAGS